jgi:hypothetical protein
LARIIWISLVLSAFSLLAREATYRTSNFLVTAPDPRTARQAAERAEYLRSRFAQKWTGGTFGPWKQAWNIKVTLTNEEHSRGFSRTDYDRGQVSGFTTVQGPLHRILAVALPHELIHLHTCYFFRREIPRWADEGMALISEDAFEREENKALIEELVNWGKPRSLIELFAVTEYPKDLGNFYAQSFSVTDFLVRSKGPIVFTRFLKDLLSSGTEAALRTQYGYSNLSDLEKDWLAWVIPPPVRTPIPR